MSSLPSPEIQPNTGELIAEQEPANIFDLEKFRQVHKPHLALADASLDAPHDYPIVEVSAEEARTYDHDLKIAEAARTDPSMFDALLNEYTGLIRHKALKFFLPDGDRDDLMQEGMLGFYKGVRDYDGKRSSFRNFAELCITRQIITAVKTSTRDKHRLLNEAVSFETSPSRQNTDDGDTTLEGLLADNTPTPEDIVVGREAFNGLLDVLMSDLSFIEYTSLKMYMEGETYEAIAEELETDVKLVDNALQRVKRKVTHYLDNAA